MAEPAAAIVPGRKPGPLWTASENGTTPRQWQLEQRLRSAQSLLETTDYPVAQIARDTGFGNGGVLRAHLTAALRPTSAGCRRTFSRVH